MVIDVEGEVSGAQFLALHTHVEEVEDSGELDDELYVAEDEDEGQTKRNQLIAELLAYHARCSGM